MNEKLQSIFVPEAVARLAKSKGFGEWCACFCNKKWKEKYYANAEGNDVNADCSFEYDWNANETAFATGLPTHGQLIKWLLQEHKIYVYMLRNGLWGVENANWKPICDKNRCFMFEINEALELALKQVKC